MPKEENEKEYGLEGESWQEGGFRFVLFCPSCAKELLATATSALYPREPISSDVDPVNGVPWQSESHKVCTSETRTWYKYHRYK